MTGMFDEEIYKGLPTPRVDAESTLWDVPASQRKYVRNWPANVDADMYQALQELAHHRDLPFQGNQSALARHCLAAGIESLRAQLGDGTATMWERLRTQQRHLTNERYALHIGEVLDKQVEFLREWSISGEWRAVQEDLILADNMIKGYPNPWWRRRAVQGWLSHSGVRALMEMWQDRMRNEAPEVWADVQKLFNRWEDVARV